MKAGILFEERRFQEALDALTSTLAELTSLGKLNGELKERVARVAMWRAIVLHHLRREAERNAALQSLVMSFPGTGAASMAADVLRKLGIAR